MEDRRDVANTYFQASLVAERMGHWVLSRNYAQQAKALYEELDDERNVGRLMMNLGGLNLMLGNPEQAIEHLKASFAVALEADSQEDAAQAPGRLATVHLHLGDYDSRRAARKALELLQGREDYLHEIGQSNVVLGRAMLERGRLEEAEEWFRAADAASSNSAPSATGRGRGSRWATCRSSWGRPRGSALVSKRRRGASRHPLLREEDTVKARLLTIAVTLALLAGAGAPWAGHTWSDGH